MLLEMTRISVVDERTSCCREPEKEMKLIIDNDRVKLETSSGYVMLSIQFKDRSIFFRNLQNYSASEQIAVPDGQDNWRIEDRC